MTFLTKKASTQVDATMGPAFNGRLVVKHCVNGDNVTFGLICLSLFQPTRLLQVTDHRSVWSDPRLLIVQLVPSSTHHPASSQAVSASHTHQGLSYIAAKCWLIMTRVLLQSCSVVLLGCFLSRPRGTHSTTWLWLAATPITAFAPKMRRLSTSMIPTQQNLCFSYRIPEEQGSNL